MNPNRRWGSGPLGPIRKGELALGIDQASVDQELTGKGLNHATPPGVHRSARAAAAPGLGGESHAMDGAMRAVLVNPMAELAKGGCQGGSL